MQEWAIYNNRVIESEIGDVHFSTILDQGFVEVYEMSPELHCHGYFEILYAIEDGFYLDTSDGAADMIDPSVICLVPPGIYHGTRPRCLSSKKLALRFRYFKIGKDGITPSLYRSFHERISSCRSVAYFSAEPDLINVLNSLRQEITTQGDATLQYTEAILNQFYLLLMRKICKLNQGIERTDPDVGISDREKRRIQIEDYFHQYYADNITEEHMADAIGLSKRQLSRVLKDI